MHLLPFLQLRRGAGKQVHLLQRSSAHANDSRLLRNELCFKAHPRVPWVRRGGIGTSRPSVHHLQWRPWQSYRTLVRSKGSAPRGAADHVSPALAWHAPAWHSPAWPTTIAHGPALPVCRAVGTRGKHAPRGRGHPGNEQGKNKEFPNVRAEGHLMLTLDLTDFSTLTQRCDCAYWGCI